MGSPKPIMAMHKYLGPVKFTAGHPKSISLVGIYHLHDTQSGVLPINNQNQKLKKGSPIRRNPLLP